MEKLSDPQRLAEKATANMATRAHTQAHGKASPCGHHADHEGLTTGLLTCD